LIFLPYGGTISRGEKMNRIEINKKTNRIILIILALIIVAEIALALYASSHHTLGLLAIGFPISLVVLLLADIPIFVFITIIANTVKEIYLHRNSYKKDNISLWIIITALVFAALSLVLFFITNNVSNVTANTVLYISTLVTAFLSTVTLVAYFIKNR